MYRYTVCDHDYVRKGSGGILTGDGGVFGLEYSGGRGGKGEVYLLRMHRRGVIVQSVQVLIFVSATCTQSGTESGL